MRRQKWTWKEGKVDRCSAHLKLYVGEWGDSAVPVALVAKPVGNSFAVEFLDVPNFSQSEYEPMKAAVTKELTFYLVEKGEPDPWKYAIYHCGTASNIYSKVHWGYFPSGSGEGNKELL